MYKYVFEKHRNVYHGRQEELKQNKKKPQTKNPNTYLKILGIVIAFLLKIKSYMTVTSSLNNFSVFTDVYAYQLSNTKLETAFT